MKFEHSSLTGYRLLLGIPAIMGVVFLFLSCRSASVDKREISSVSSGKDFLCGCPTATCRQLRTRLLQQMPPAFAVGKADTVFLMESSGSEDGRPVGRIWTTKWATGYSYDPNTKLFDFTTIPFYKHHIELVGKFDSTSLNAERALLNLPGYGTASGVRSISATRLIGRGQKRECVSFKFVEVVYPKRDFYQN